MRLVDATEGKTREASAFGQQALPLPSSWPVPFFSAQAQSLKPWAGSEFLLQACPGPGRQLAEINAVHGIVDGTRTPSCHSPSRLLAPLRRHRAAPKLSIAAGQEYAEMPDIGAEVA